MCNLTVLSQHILWLITGQIEVRIRDGRERENE